MPPGGWLRRRPCPPKRHPPGGRRGAPTLAQPGAAPPGGAAGTGLSLAGWAYAGARNGVGHRRGVADGRGRRGGHPALHAVGQDAEQPLVVPWSELVGHVLVTGTTRSGKTRLLEVLASEAIRGPGAVVMLDPKGDRDLLARCAAEAQRQRRPFALLTPAFPAAVGPHQRAGYGHHPRRSRRPAFAR